MKTQVIAFHDSQTIAFGDLHIVAAAVKNLLDRDPSAHVLIFDAITSDLIELDFRGTLDDMLSRLEPAPVPDSHRGPGRPRLGVVAREVTLLPRHWDWLNSQPGGASVALRKLVEHARKDHAGKDRIRRAQESAYRFLSAMAGNEPGFEEALRALFTGNATQFEK
jgi:hypothetical protein